MLEDSMNQIRPAAVAGMFYPADSRQLEKMVSAYLEAAANSGQTVPKAIIAPHAGYIYSGPIAASAYARLSQAAATLSRIVLLGPSHRVPLRGLALPSAELFATPLGNVAVDQTAVAKIRALPQVIILDEAHEGEHSLEVHLPFLQMTCGQFQIVPLVVGQADTDSVAEVLESIWGGPETLIVISSDLSHFHDYATARTVDKRTAAAIEHLDGAALHENSACGRFAIRGMLEVAKKRGLQGQTIDLRNSGDTAGPKNRVVGYGAFVFN
jgi:AmmeMemoRadiSam system protein B